ncbi:MAG: bacillithiol biosynthesis deacetylase BshB1 [Coriobacteriia bacterium]
METAVCVGAHPDDVEIGMGATVASMAASGIRVVLVDLTDGEPTPHGDRRMRMTESAKAARELGAATRVCLDLPNRELTDSVDARRALAAVLREERPRWVFSPYPLDAHPDHVAASAIAVAARFYAKLTKTDMPGEPHYPPRLYQYYAMHLRTPVVPSFVVSVPEGREQKMRALAAYESQFGPQTGNAGLPERVDAWGRHWGAYVGSEFAEPFFAPEVLGIRSFSDLV